MIFNLAKEFAQSPLEVSRWPAALVARARMWMSGRNQADADRIAIMKREQGGK